MIRENEARKNRLVKVLLEISIIFIIWTKIKHFSNAS